MSCIQQILCHGTSHVSQAYKPNGLSLREIGDNEKKKYLKRNTTLRWRKKTSWLHISCTMSTKVSQETNVLIIIKQVFTTYFSELSNSPEKNRKPATQLSSCSSVTRRLPLKHPYGNSQMPDCPCHTAG